MIPIRLPLPVVQRICQRNWFWLMMQRAKWHGWRYEIANWQWRQDELTGLMLEHATNNGGDVTVNVASYGTAGDSSPIARLL